jgi:serine/threonine protein kinase
MKKIKVEIEDEGIPTTALREITLLRQLDHPNVVKLENVVMDPARLYLVFELVDTDLKKYMDNYQGPLAPELVHVRIVSIFTSRNIHDCALIACIFH